MCGPADGVSRLSPTYNLPRSRVPSIGRRRVLGYLYINLTLESDVVSTAALVRDRVIGAPRGSFMRSADFPGPSSAVDMALSRLASERGPLVRVGRGVYWKGVDSRFGKGAPPALDAALEVAGPGSGPAGWSALRFLGLTTQLPASPHVAVPGRQPALRNARVSKRSNALRILLNPAEVAVLEVLRQDWIDRVDGGQESLTEALRRLTAGGRVRPDLLDKVAAHETSLVRRRWASARASL